MGHCNPGKHLTEDGMNAGPCTPKPSGLMPTEDQQESRKVRPLREEDPPRSGRVGAYGPTTFRTLFVRNGQPETSAPRREGG